MPPKRVTCEFHRRGRCNKGARCSNVHVGPPGGAARTAPSSSTGEATASEAPSRRQPDSNAPSGVCKEYYNTGDCSRSFDCRFRHARATDVGPANFVSPESFGNASTINDTTSNAQLSPTEAHNALNRFTRPGFGFDTALNMYPFIACLASAKEDNRSWVRAEVSVFSSMHAPNFYRTAWQALSDGQVSLDSIVQDCQVLTVGRLVATGDGWRRKL